MSSQLIFIENPTSPATPNSGTIALYAKTDGNLYSKNDAGSEQLIINTTAIGALVGDVTATGPGTATATVVSVGGSLAAAIHTAAVLAATATSSNVASSLVLRDASGNFSANIITANLSGTATSFSGSLSGDVTGTQTATSIASTTVTSKLITGFLTGAGTVTAADTILAAINKLDGNDALRALKSGDTFTGNIVVSNQNSLRLQELSINGTEFVGLQASPSMSASFTMQLPAVQGGAGQYITNDGTGQLGWVTPSLSGFTTDSLPEGSTNLYFTTNRAKDAAGASLANTSTVNLTYTGGTHTITADVVSGSLTNTQISSTAAIAYSKLNLTNTILNSDISGTAAIAMSKLAALTISRAVVSDTSGYLTTSITTNTEVGYLSGVTSAIQTQLNGKQATGNYITGITGDVVATGPGSVSSTIQAGVVTATKLGTVTDGVTLDQLGTGSTLEVKAGGISNTQISNTAAIAYSKLFLANSIQNSDIAAAAGIPYSKLTLTGAILNADIATAAAISYSKLNLTNAILNADISSSASIAYSKLNLTNTIQNSDISGTAAIAVSKLAALTISRAVVSDASGYLTTSVTTNTEVGYLSGVTSSIQTQLNSKQTTGNYITALTGDVVATGPGSVSATIQAGAVTTSKLGTVTDGVTLDQLGTGSTLEVKSGGISNTQISGTAAIALTKLAATTVSRALASDASGFIIVSSTTSTELGYVSGVTSSIQTQLNGKQPTITVLPIANGGTNSGVALSNNRVIQSSGGAIVEAAAITASRALVSDANGIPTQSATTSTELGYVSGVTSSIQTQLGTKANLSGAQMTGYFRRAVVALTDAANIATDVSLGNIFTVTIAGNRTLSAPTNMGSSRQACTWVITQDATGGRTLAFDSVFNFGIDLLLIGLSTTPGATDYIGAMYNPATSRWDIIAITRGY